MPTPGAGELAGSKFPVNTLAMKNDVNEPSCREDFNDDKDNFMLIRWLLVAGLLLYAGDAAGDSSRAPFPDPFSLESPESSSRAGGIEFRYQYHEGATTLAFPLVSNLTTTERNFTIQLFLPRVLSATSAARTRRCRGSGFASHTEFIERSTVVCFGRTLQKLTA